MVFLTGLNSLLLVATLLPFWRKEHYLVRGWDFPRLQLAWLGAFSLGAQTWWVGWNGSAELMVGLLALSCVVIQLGWIWPYTVWARVEVAAGKKRSPDDSLRILTANVWQPNRRAEDFLKIVTGANPDVVVVLEADEWWERELAVLEKEGYRERLSCPRDNLYGMLLFSRLLLVDTAVAFLVEERVPSMHATVVLRSGKEVRTHWLHPSPPSPTENPESTQRDAELVMVGKRVKEHQGTLPVVVAGDLNDVAWSATTRLFRRVSGLLDPRVGRGFSVLIMRKFR